MAKAAAKQNKPKSKKYEGIWDITYMFQYLHGLAPTDYKGQVEHTIVLLKSLLGWRSADLTGVYRELSFRKGQSGYFIRYFDGKATKKAWSGWSFLPRLTE